MQSSTKKHLLSTLVFLVLNFSALAIGGFFTGKGVPSDWYANLNKAPWTPPGWVFGAAWTTIMICFAIYMASWIGRDASKRKIYMLYGVQWLLNVAWNPIFFSLHWVGAGLAVIVALTLLVTFLLFRNQSRLGWRSAFIWPYALWLLIATSLNAYILVFN